MSSVSQLSTREHLYDSVSLWLAKMDRGLSVAEEAELKEWLGKDDMNCQVFLSMAEQWDKMDALSCLSDIFPRTAVKTVEPRRFSVPAMAASLIFALLVGMAGVVQFRQILEAGGENISNSVVSNLDSATYETAVGEQSYVSLSDGTLILLNTNTSVRVSYTATERLLQLQRGELNVEVAHNPDRPLRVIAGDRVVEAVGTAFNMRLTQNSEVELLVTEGKVVVTRLEKNERRANSSTQVAQTYKPSSASLAVSAGEEIVLGSEEESPHKIEIEDIEVKLSWREGDLTFRGESLEQAMSEVGRYTSTEFIFLDEEVRAVRIAGRFKAGDMDTLLTTLQDNFNITYHQVGENTIELGAR